MCTTERCGLHTVFTLFLSNNPFQPIINQSFFSFALSDSISILCITSSFVTNTPSIIAPVDMRVRGGGLVGMSSFKDKSLSDKSFTHHAYFGLLASAVVIVGFCSLIFFSLYTVNKSTQFYSTMLYHVADRIVNAPVPLPPVPFPRDVVNVVEQRHNFASRFNHANRFKLGNQPLAILNLQPGNSVPQLLVDMKHGNITKHFLL